MDERVKELEVHEHHFVSGPRSNRSGNWPTGIGSQIAHSHEGGNAPHAHPDTGPASYTIDKDEWARRTGMKGGGRKKFTAKPTGEQFPLIAQEPQSFEVFILDSAKLAQWDGKAVVPLDGPADGEPVMFAAERMKLAFGMTARVHDLRSRQRKVKP